MSPENKFSLAQGVMGNVRKTEDSTQLLALRMEVPHTKECVWPLEAESTLFLPHPWLRVSEETGVSILQTQAD